MSHEANTIVPIALNIVVLYMIFIMYSGTTLIPSPAGHENRAVKVKYTRRQVVVTGLCDKPPHVHCLGDMSLRQEACFKCTRSHFN